MSLADLSRDSLPFEDDLDGDFDTPELANAIRDRDHWLREVVIHASDMAAGAEALFGLLERFGDRLDRSEREEMLRIHARLAYPQAQFEQDIAQLTQKHDARKSRS
jgi:hypothetical protein